MFIYEFCVLLCMQQIIIRQLEKPREKDVHGDIDWMCNSFGLSSGRDISATAPRIFYDLLERVAREMRVPSEAIAEDLLLNQAIVNHHIRNFANSGIVYRERKLICLRGGSVKSAVEELRKDANRMFDDIGVIAEEIDAMLGLKNRE